MVKAAVMGSGSFGTAFSKVLSDAGTDVAMWARRAEVADSINSVHLNPSYMKDVLLPESVVATANHKEALADADFVILAIPSQSLRENLAKWAEDIPADATLVSLAKGIETGTLMRMTQVIAEVTGARPDRIAVISGPNLAGEIVKQQPTATVVGCTDSVRAVALQRACATGYFRPYTNSDVIGCEVGGACKNVIALCCGMAAGIGLGENSSAAIITRGLAEMTRLGEALGANAKTLAGLAGVGDLVATCTSPLSRNRSFGVRLGEGDTLEQAQEAANGQVAEGVKSCSSVLELAESYGVEMPLTKAVHEICHEGKNVGEALRDLLGRRIKPE